MKWSEQEKKEVLLSILLNISALCYFPFILLGIIVPFAVWVFTRDKYRAVDEVGKRLLNFQICWCLLTGYLFAMMFIIPAFHLLNDNPNAEIIMLIQLLYIINALFIVFNSIRCYLGKEVFYPALRFIR